MNPLLLTALRSALPYLLAGAAGFASAYWIQGLRITSAVQEFAQYKLDEQRQAQEAKVKADEQRAATAAGYHKQLEALENDNEIYRRCIAAGKCGGMPKQPAMPGLKLQATTGITRPGTDAVPAAGEPAPQVVLDCAKTTLMLNRLQDDIERQ